MSKSYKEIALSYAERGVKVFPCEPNNKKPLCRNGFKDATTDKAKISRWWSKNPDALIAAPCEDQFMIVDVDLKNGAPAFESLGKIYKYIKDTATMVTTKNGGHHYYFKYDSDIGRKIGVIHSIDILGKGGYTVLPDGERYVQNGDLESFLNTIVNGLTVLDHRMTDSLKGIEELPELQKVKKHKPAEKRPSGTAKETSEEEFRDEVADAIEADALASHNKMYEKIGKMAGYEAVEFNGDPIKVKPKTMTTRMFNSIFHNKDVQKRIATYMGIPIPNESTGKGVNFRSLLPSHSDENPSMAARWTSREDGGHSIIVRDFSNHYNNGKEDYNLTRLFMVKSYGKNYRKPSPTEFYVWSIRLLEDAGVVEFDKPIFNGITKHLTEGQKKAAEGFLRLVGIKKLWKGGGDETCYSQKFAAAWSGVSTETVNKMKAKAIKFGIIEKSGKVHGEGAMQTPIFKLGLGAILVQEINTISEMIMAVNDKLKRKKKETGSYNRFNVSTPKSQHRVNNTQERSDERPLSMRERFKEASRRRRRRKELGFET